MTDPILLRKEGAIAWVTINRPERMNAMDSTAHVAFSEALVNLADDQ